MHSQDGLTPLQCAATEGCAAVVRVLVKDYHANVDAVVAVRCSKIGKVQCGKVLL